MKAFNHVVGMLQSIVQFFLSHPIHQTFLTYFCGYFTFIEIIRITFCSLVFGLQRQFVPRLGLIVLNSFVCMCVCGMF